MNDYKKIKYFEYARKSGEGEDRQVQSIERQQEENAKLTERLGLSVIGVFSESRSAMKPNNRPIFNEMIKRIKKGEANGILCWHINRLCRNPLEAGIIQQLLSDGILKSIQTKDKEYLPSDNLIIISVETAMSSQYSKDLGDAVKSGIEKKLKKGMAPITAPIGYLNTRRELRGENYIIKDPERFETVRKAWQLMLTGAYTPPTILDIVNNEFGLRTRPTNKRPSKPLSKSSIYRIFGDPFYTGLFLYSDTTHQGTHEPMITLEEYDKVQWLLGRAGRPRPQKHIFDYTGTMKCGECGSAITACEKRKVLKSTGELKTYILYHCTRRKKGAENCTQRKYLAVEELEIIIKNELKSCTISPKFSELSLEMIQAEYGDKILQKQKLLKSQQKELVKLDTEIKNLLQMRLADAISNEEYQTERKLRESKKVRLNQKIQQMEKGITSIADSKISDLNALINIDEKFDKGSSLAKKEIFLSVGWNHELKDKNLFITKHKWLKSLIEAKEPILSYITRWESEINQDPQRKKEVFDLLRPVVRDLIDDVGAEGSITESKK